MSISCWHSPAMPALTREPLRSRGAGWRRQAVKTAARPEPASPARLAVLDLQHAHVAAQDEVVVDERERARDTVVIKLESDGIDRRLLAAFCIPLEITDGYRPACHAVECLLPGSRISRHTLIWRDRRADDGKCVEYLFAILRAVIDRQLQHRLAGARRCDDAAHVLGRKYHPRVGIELFPARLGQIHRHTVGAAVSLSVNCFDLILVDQVLRLEAVTRSGAVFPGDGAQIAYRRLSLARIQLGNLAELQRVPIAGIAREIIQNASRYRLGRTAVARMGKTQVIN